MTSEWETPRHIPAQGHPEGQRAAMGMSCKPVSPAHFYYYQKVFTVVNTSDGRREGSNMSTEETKGGRYGAAGSSASPSQLPHSKGDVKVADFYFSFVNRMVLGKKWFRSVQNSDELLAALKIRVRKSAFGIQGNILYLPKRNYTGVFMGYLTLCHQYFIFVPNPPLPHHADSIL